MVACPNRKNQRGISLIEVSIGVAVAFSLTAMLVFAAQAANQSIDADALVRDVRLLKRSMEIAYPNGDYQSFSPAALVSRTGAVLAPIFVPAASGPSGHFRSGNVNLEINPNSSYRSYQDAQRQTSTIAGSSFYIRSVQGISPDACLEIGKTFFNTAIRIWVSYPSGTGGSSEINPQAGHASAHLVEACNVAGAGLPVITLEFS